MQVIYRYMLLSIVVLLSACTIVQPIPQSYPYQPILQLGHNERDSRISLNWIQQDGNPILVSTDERQSIYWDVKAGKLLQRQPLPAKETTSTDNSLTFDSKDGKQLLSVELFHINLKDKTTGKVLRSAPIEHNKDYYGNIAVAPWASGEPVLLAGAGGSGIWIYDLTAQRYIQRIPYQDFHVGSPMLAFSPDRSELAYYFGGDEAVEWIENKLRIWNVASGKLLFTAPGINASISGTALHSDGRQLAMISSDNKTVRIWDIPTGRQLKTYALDKLNTMYGFHTFENTLHWDEAGEKLYFKKYDYTVTPKVLNLRTGKLTPLSTIDAKAVFASKTSTQQSEGSHHLKTRIYHVTINLDNQLQVQHRLTGRLLYQSWLLPDGEWLTNQPGKPQYMASKQAEQYFQLRVGNTLEPMTAYQQFKVDKLFQ